MGQSTPSSINFSPSQYYGIVKNTKIRVYSQANIIYLNFTTSITTFCWFSTWFTNNRTRSGQYSLRLTINTINTYNRYENLNYHYDDINFLVVNLLKSEAEMRVKYSLGSQPNDKNKCLFIDKKVKHELRFRK